MNNEYVIPQDAIKFLEILGKDPAKTRLRSIPRQKTKTRVPKKGSFSKEVLQGWVQESSGIYVVINDGGDTDQEITDCRALFLEHDDRSIAEQATCWKGVLPEPTMQVFTGGKSLHQYWVFENPVDPHRWKALTQKAIQKFESDPNINNPSRVMRLPGFPYFDCEGNKGELASIYACSGQKYRIEELEAALSDVVLKPHTSWISGKQALNTNHEWHSAKPCPICGRDLDDKCRITIDETYIQCHQGDRFWPPDIPQGSTIKDQQGRAWKKMGITSNCFGKAIGFKIQQPSKTPHDVKTKQDLITFVKDEFGESLEWNQLKMRVELNGDPLKNLELQHCLLADRFQISHTSVNVRDAFLYVAKQNEYHPVQRYLESVEDKDAGISLDQLGRKYLSLETDIESKLFGLHLLAAVCRAFSPGYPYDQILILKGAQ